MINLILFLVAFSMSIVLYTVGFIYNLFRSIKHGGFKQYLYNIAFTIDQSGNVICGPMFNDWFRKKEGKLFGNQDETISHVLGKNQESKTLYPLGKIIAGILNLLDKDHCYKAANNPQFNVAPVPESVPLKFRMYKFFYKILSFGLKHDIHWLSLIAYKGMGLFEDKDETPQVPTPLVGKEILDTDALNVNFMRDYLINSNWKLVSSQGWTKKGVVVGGYSLLEAFEIETA